MKLTVINSILSHLVWQLKKGQGDPKCICTDNFLFKPTLTDFMQNVIKAEVP